MVVKTIASCRPEERNVFVRLWGENEAQGVQMDEVSMFSVTPHKIADEISKQLFRLPGISARSVVTDATSCVGGNAVSFAKVFSCVNAIELDDTRCDMLKHNVDYCRRDNPTMRGTVYIYCGDALNLIMRLRQDVLFLDPPWGGRDYRSKSKVQLFLSNVPLAQVILHGLNHSRYVALKLPKNYDLEPIERDHRMGVHLKREFSNANFFLLVVKSLLREEEPAEAAISTKNYDSNKPGRTQPQQQRGSKGQKKQDQPPVEDEPMRTDVEQVDADPRERQMETLLATLLKTPGFQDLLKSQVWHASDS